MADGLLASHDAIWASALTANCKLTLLAMLSHWSKSKSFVFPSISRLSHLTGLSERTVRRAVTSLETGGVIRVHRQIGKSNTYTPHLQHLPKHAADPGQPDRGNPGHPDTPVRESGVTESQGTPVTLTGSPRSQWPPKRPSEETKEETQSRVRAREGKSGSRSKSKMKAEKSQPSPHAHSLKQHYVESYKRTQGSEPVFAKKQWGRAMKAFSELGDLVGLDGAKKVISNALADGYNRRLQPWELVQDANKWRTARPGGRTSIPPAQGGPRTFEVGK